MLSSSNKFVTFKKTSHDVEDWKEKYFCLWPKGQKMRWHCLNEEESIRIHYRAVTGRIWIVLRLTVLRWEGDIYIQGQEARRGEDILKYSMQLPFSVNLGHKNRRLWGREILIHCTLFYFSQKISWGWVDKGNQYKQWRILIHLGNWKQCSTLRVGWSQTDMQVVENSMTFWIFICFEDTISTANNQVI